MPFQDACSTDTYIHGHPKEHEALTFHRALSGTRALLFRNPQLPPHQTPHPVKRFKSVMPMFRFVQFWIQNNAVLSNIQDSNDPLHISPTLIYTQDLA